MENVAWDLSIAGFVLLSPKNYLKLDIFDFQLLQIAPGTYVSVELPEELLALTSQVKLALKDVYT